MFKGCIFCSRTVRVDHELKLFICVERVNCEPRVTFTPRYLFTATIKSQDQIVEEKYRISWCFLTKFLLLHKNHSLSVFSLFLKDKVKKEKFNFYGSCFSKSYSNQLLPFPSVVLESWLDFTGELEPPDPLARLPQLKRRIKQLLIDMGKVQQIATLCSVWQKEEYRSKNRFFTMNFLISHKTDRKTAKSWAFMWFFADYINRLKL